MVQKSSALIVAAIGLSAVTTMAVPVPGGLFGLGAKLLEKGGSKVLAKTASSGGAKALERTASRGATKALERTGSSMLKSKSKKSTLSRVAHQTSKHLPGTLDNANSAMNLYSTYQFSKPQAQQQQQPTDDGSGYQGREFDDMDMLERDYEFDDIEARSPRRGGGGVDFKGFLNTAKNVAGSAGSFGLGLLKDAFTRELDERSYDLEELETRNIDRKKVLKVAGTVGKAALTVLPFVLRENELEELD